MMIIRFVMMKNTKMFRYGENLKGFKILNWGGLDFKNFKPFFSINVVPNLMINLFCMLYSSCLLKNYNIYLSSFSTINLSINVYHILFINGVNHFYN